MNLISSDSQLAEAARIWAGRPWLALDTEFVREDTYYSQLALVQVGDGDSEACIDMLAVQELGPLLALCDDPGIVKVLHSPSQDLEIFMHRWGRGPTPLFDSQLAATLLGIADQPGYAALVQAMLGLSLDKSLSRTPWLRRPLSAAELEYAAADVEHLGRIYPQLLQQLSDRGRLVWLQEDCARMLVAEHYRPQPQLEWRRLKGLARLEVGAQHVAAELAAWRDVVAEQRDRPRKWMLSDDALYAIAERQPSSREQLAALSVLAPKQLERHTEALLACVERGRAVDAPALARDERDNTALKAKVQSLQQRVRELATKHGLPPGLLATRSELERIAAGASRDEVTGEELRALCGWRRELLGDALRA